MAYRKPKQYKSKWHRKKAIERYDKFREKKKKLGPKNWWITK